MRKDVSFGSNKLDQEWPNFIIRGPMTDQDANREITMYYVYSAIPF